MLTNQTPTQPERSSARHGLRFSLAAAIVMTAISVLAIGILCYWIPYRLQVLAGTYHAGLIPWCRGWHIAVPHSLSPSAFTTYLAYALNSAWIFYAALLGLAYRVRTSAPPWILWSGAIICLTIAFVFPPSLSGDSYTYIGYGRAQAVHHLNPYITPLGRLVDLHDGFLAELINQPHGEKAVTWASDATVYGPVWTLLSTLIAAVTAHAPAMYGVLGIKLVAAVSLFASAVAASRIAERLSLGTGLLSFAAVALNPLALMEGPGQGHNDLLTMALILWALLACIDRKPAAAGLYIGLATAVKLFPVALLPWIIWKLREPGKPWLRDAGLVVACCAAPLAIGYACFWAGSDMFTSLHTFVGGRVQHSPLPTLLMYAAASVWVLRSKDRGVILSAWPLVALPLALWNPLKPFPWYLLWAIQPASSRWNRLHVVYVGLMCLMVYMWQSLWYAVLVH